MMGEYYVFSGLLKKYGAPRIVIPNTPTCHFSRRGSVSSFVADAPPAGIGPFGAAVWHCRIPLGHEPFLTFAKYVEVDAPVLRAVRDALIAMGVVEVRYGRRNGPRGGVKPVVRVAVREDVTPLGAKAFDEARDRSQVVGLHSESSMGDTYVGFHLVTREDRDSFCFLFDAPVSDRELGIPSAEGSWSSTLEVLDDFREHFTRQLPFDYTSPRRGGKNGRKG